MRRGRTIFSNPSLSYGKPLSRPVRVDSLPPRWQASQDGVAKSRGSKSNSGCFSRRFLNSGRHTEEATSESRRPENFRRVTCKGTEKYSSSVKGFILVFGKLTVPLYLAFAVS